MNCDSWPRVDWSNCLLELLSVFLTFLIDCFLSSWKLTCTISSVLTIFLCRKARTFGKILYSNSGIFINNSDIHFSLLRIPDLSLHLIGICIMSVDLDKIPVQDLPVFPYFFQCQEVHCWFSNFVKWKFNWTLHM